MKFTGQYIETLAAKLRDMPPVDKSKQEYSKQVAVKLISKEIHAMQKRGYTLARIAETLSAEGFSIGTATLRSYLQRAKPAKRDQTETPRDSKPATKAQADTSKTTFTPTSDTADI